MEEDWVADFKEECERNLKRSVAYRIRSGFTYEYRPILDDAPWRSFDSMEEYRDWCDKHFPKYMSYGTSGEMDQDDLARQTALIARSEIDRRRKLRI